MSATMQTSPPDDLELQLQVMCVLPGKETIYQLYIPTWGNPLNTWASQLNAIINFERGTQATANVKHSERCFQLERVMTRYKNVNE